MKKLLLLLTLTIVVINVKAQNKKEQLLILTNRFDSLNMVVLTKNSELIEKQNQIAKLQQELTTNKQKLENTLNQNQVLTQQIIDLEKPQLKYDCSGAVGNSSRNYPFRISGVSNGCIGEVGEGEGDCEKIPSDLDLHSAILVLKDDYNGDTVIDVLDLAPAIEKIGDVNIDSKIDIYEILYPEPLNYTVAVKNPNLLHDNGSIYNLMGIISSDGRLKLRLPIDLTDDNSGEGGNIGRVSEIDLWGSTNIVVYCNKTVVLRGKLLSGNTQSYRNNFAFQVDQIVGIVK